MPNETTAPVRSDPATLREELRGFGAAYDYDTSYLAEVLEASPGGFAAFSGAQPLSGYRSALPLDAHFVARIGTMQAEDCGACAQLNLRMAVEAGVDRGLLETLIERPSELPAILADVRGHALGVARGETVDPARAARLREHYGEEAFAELALCITGSRVFPTLKRALDRMTSCSPLHLDF